MHDQPAIFEEHAIRRVCDAATETWWFSVVDIIQVLTQQIDYQTARKYWNKLKQRLSKEGNESVTDCHRLKLPAADGKNYLINGFRGFPVQKNSAHSVCRIGLCGLAIPRGHAISVRLTHCRLASADF